MLKRLPTALKNFPAGQAGAANPVQIYYAELLLAVAAFSIYNGVYLSGIIRSGLAAVEPGWRSRNLVFVCHQQATCVAYY